MTKPLAARSRRGFTLIETVVSLMLVTTVVVVVGVLQRQVFSLDRLFQGVLFSQREARQALKTVTAELRTTNVSNTGAYPLATADASTLTFYSDRDNDTVRERLRYFIEGTALKRGIIEPSGNPFAYDPASETVATVVSGIDPSATRFEYYPGSYDGTTAPLSQPVVREEVRLVKVTIVIDRNPNEPPAPVTFTSQVSLRNLKDNL